MPDQPYTVEQGFECCQDGGYRLYSCAYCPCMKPDRPPCLVVTGDLEKARRRLAPLDDAAIERAARRLYAADPRSSAAAGVEWEEAGSGERYEYLDLARVALAAAEETPDA